MEAGEGLKRKEGTSFKLRILPLTCSNRLFPIITPADRHLGNPIPPLDDQVEGFHIEYFCLEVLVKIMPNVQCHSCFCSFLSSQKLINSKYKSTGIIREGS